jgi:hypothetical protein
MITIMEHSGDKTKKNGPGGACVGTSGVQVHKGVLVGRATDKRTLEKPRRWWQDINMDRQKMGWEEEYTELIWLRIWRNSGIL